MRASWLPERSHGPPGFRSGFALGWVGGLLLLLALVAFSLWFVTNTTQANLTRAVVGQVYMDLAISALSETVVAFREAVVKDEVFHGVNFNEALAKEFPFDPFKIEPTATTRLARRLYPGVTVSPVTVRPVGRSPPGEENPLLGSLEMVVTASGRLGGFKTGREVTYRFVFATPCSVAQLPSDEGTYMRIHWGRPVLYTKPVSTLVKRL
ncbi:MAG: hypothetical protein HY815_23805 [Candidatus Riflebacteria bacterium]|nr:hypothetical protein [Candidatus Riflebacteria bacterium]